MIETREIERIAEEEACGIYTTAESCWRVFRMIDGRNLPEVVRRLPPELRDEFTGWAQRNLGNDLSRTEFVYVRGAEHPQFEEALAAVRSWLAFG